MKRPARIARNIWNFYAEGFRNMTLGKVLWTIILVKVFILFAILRVFFFRPALADYPTPEAKAGAVIKSLTVGSSSGKPERGSPGD